MNSIFPQQTLSDTEIDLIAEIFSNPMVKKYLHTLAYNIGSELVTSVIGTEESEESWVRKEIFLKGQLRTIDALLSINAEASKTN